MKVDLMMLQMRGQGVSVKDVNQHEFVKAFAAFLKKWVMISGYCDCCENWEVQKWLFYC